MRNIHDLRDDRGQAGAVKTDVNVAGHVFLVVVGVEVYTEQDRPDIQKILSKQGKPEHQAAGCDRMSVHLHIEEIDGPDT